MSRLKRFLWRCYNVLRPGRAEADASREFAAHLSLLEEDFQGRGLSPDQARVEARRAFGGVLQAREIHRDARSFAWLDDARRDVPQALRMMRRTPGFTLVAVLTLALGIGANTAIFSLVEGVILKALPVSSPADLFALRVINPVQGRQRFSYPAFEELRLAVSPPDGLAAMSTVARFNVVVDSSRQAETTAVQLVSGEYFSVLGLSAQTGRTIFPEDNRTIDGHPVAVVSDGFWRRRLGQDPAAIGRSLTVSGRVFTIVGVAPRGFSGVWADSPVDLWVPLVMQQTVRYKQNFGCGGCDDDRPWALQPGLQWLEVIGRLVPQERSHQRARLEAAFHDLTARTVDAGNPEARRKLFEQKLILESFERGFSTLRREYASPLFILMALVALVLLVACASIAALLQARAVARTREISVRLAMGASRGRLIRQLLSESLLLAMFGGTAGLLVATWTSGALVHLALVGSSAASLPEFPLNWRTFGFAAGLSVATALLFGLAPALRATRVDPQVAFKEGGRSSARRSGKHGMNPVIALQVSLSVMLLVAAGLFARTLSNLYRVDPGFDVAHLISVRFDHQGAGFTGEQVPQLYDRLVGAIQAIPGIASVSISSCDVISGCRSTVGDYDFPDHPKRPGEHLMILENRVGAGYFSTLGLPVVEGREFNARDTGQSPKVAIVNQSMARRYFGTDRAAGKRFRHSIERDEEYEVVGVVRDARVVGLREPPEPMIYYPVTQAPLRKYGGGVINVRAADPVRAIAGIRAAVTRVEPALPFGRLATLSEVTGIAVNRERLVAYLASAFGMLAVILASVGLYGVTAYGVEHRTHEFGIRMALGARRWNVISGVVAESLVCVGWGLGIGLLLSMAASRMLSTVISGALFEVTPGDTVVFTVAPLALLAAAAVAAFLPVRRASRIDPLVALRYE
jgi:predicted permease